MKPLNTSKRALNTNPPFFWDTLYVRLKDTVSLDSVTLEKCLLRLEDQETKCSKLILPDLLEEKLDKLKLRLKLKNISIRTQRDEEENIMKSEASKIFTYGYSAGYSPKNLVDVSYVAKLIRSKYLTNVKKIQIQNLSLFRKKDEDDLENNYQQRDCAAWLQPHETYQE